MFCFWCASTVRFRDYSCICHVRFQWHLRDKWAVRPYQKPRAVTVGLSGQDKRKSWLISNSGNVARRYRWSGWRGLSRSDKQESRVSSGGRGHARWCQDLCCPPSVVLLMLRAVCKRWRGKVSDWWTNKSRQQGPTEMFPGWNSLSVISEKESHCSTTGYLWKLVVLAHCGNLHVVFSPENSQKHRYQAKIL